ncbi:bifunctional UDP-N-acetylmuramoyl-tripeptide:D-alanyl-D-alanine ligase/alanine racemase [Sunxiuqinia sp. A32]|uniref:bifunctional UDP-N-acetylmuramoyl-tripeptide:D-alanyl-D-alanine ligase/alanine racemase n=1 Tax=Sunxiuqinia sp. A32 TaxID=3461496 RepID=UPI004045E2F8
MIGISLSKISDIIGGQLIKSNFTEELFAISIDSRTIVDAKSTLFFAITGERHNGHDYIIDLYNKGVRSFVVSEMPEKFENLNEAGFVLVGNTLKALQIFASWYRNNYEYPVLAITGSNGKTIVKEWLFDLLANRRIIRSPKSYNSQVGVPLSVLNMNEHFDLAIFEAGISMPNEMTNLAEVISPDFGIFTNIGDAHQESFQSLEQKILEKLVLFESCKSLIYNLDNSMVDQIIRQKFEQSPVELYSWSFQNKMADLFIQVQKEDNYSVFQFKSSGKDWSIKIPFSDDASLENSAHCLAFIVLQNELSEMTEKRFAFLQPVAMRLELKDGINNCTLINDYYNSDINSLEIALQFLNQQTSLNHKRKTVILSEIQQSGLSKEILQYEVLQLLKLTGINHFVAIGMEWLKEQTFKNMSTSFYKSTSEFIADFKAENYDNEIILIKGARDFRFERISSLLQKKYHQTTLEIRLNEMVENLNSYKSLLKPETKVMVMVKAFSYGSGTVEVARMLQYQQVDYLAVAVADEGIELRQAGIETPIVVMNPEEHSFETMIEYRLEPNIYSEDVLNGFERVANRLAVQEYPIHLKIDSGMHRLGFDTQSDFEKIVSRISNTKLFRIKSIFSHLSASDDPAHDEFTHEQYNRFEKMCSIVKKIISYKVDRHILNSAGIERFSELQMEMVRLGIGLYGISASSKISCNPIARWVTSISQVRDVKPGETVGYSRMGKVVEPKRVAVLPVGYADGYDRRFSNGGSKVWVNGKFASIIGNVCMDMCMIDVSEIIVKPGDSVELMGEHVKLNDLAAWAGTIPYEILTGISQRVKRIYIQE